MKKEAFRIVRRYRKSFASLATRNQKLALDFWFSYNTKTDGVIDLLVTDCTISVEECLLISKYFAKQWQRLYNIYCK